MVTTDESGINFEICNVRVVRKRGYLRGRLTKADLTD